MHGRFTFRRHGWALLVLTTMVLAGCAGSEEPEGGTASFDLRVRQALAEAREGGASEQQLAMIARAAESGEVSIEDLRTSVNATIECMNSQGLDAYAEDHITNAGLRVPAYVVNIGDVSEDLALDIQDRCEQAETFWINKLFYFQPSSLALNDTYLQQQAPILLECVIRNGGDASEGDDVGLVLDAASELFMSSGGQINCFLEAKIDSY